MPEVIAQLEKALADAEASNSAEAFRQSVLNLLRLLVAERAEEYRSLGGTFA